MEAFFISTGVVTLGEMGDKTQLLAILLAARYRKPLLIISAILLATLANHAVAAWVGNGIAILLGPDVLRWLIGLSFIAMAAWIMIPDKIDTDLCVKPRYGVFCATFVAFFIAEIGDKTQIATVALAAHYADLGAVIAGTTLGMMLANVPAVLLGETISRKIRMQLLHGIAALIFLVMGVMALLSTNRFLG